MCSSQNGARLLVRCVLFAAIWTAGAEAPPAAEADADPWVWLEESEGKRPLEWVKTQNQRTLARLSQSPTYQRYYELALGINEEQKRIPGAYRDGMLHDGWIYNIWQDGSNPRGVIRRTRLESYRSGEPDWQILLDIDALAAREKKDWKFQLFLPSHFEPARDRRCLIWLSDRGGEESVFREFDLEHRAFVEGGFVLPQAKSSVVWKDENALLVATDWGPGSLSMSLSAPLIVKEWSRGEPLSSAKEVLRGGAEDRELSPQVLVADTDERVLFVRQKRNDGRSSHWLLDRQGRLTPMTLPHRPLFMALHRGEWVVSILEDWTAGGKTWPAGSILSIPMAEITRNAPTIRLLAEPGPREMFLDLNSTRDGVLVTGYSNVRGRLLRFKFEDGRWSRNTLPIPDNGTVRLAMTDPTSPTAFASYEDFLRPTILYAVDVGRNRVRAAKGLPPQFDDECCLTEQLEATSPDGARIPYFLVRPKKLAFDGTTPTLMYGYGGYGAPLYPRYSGALGRLWLESGGAYVLANIRGGGEFGRKWHEAAIKTRRQTAYDDFIAVAEDLIRRKITAPRHLGIEGESNGGLLMGVMLTQRPELFNAAIIEVPVLDLFRMDLMQGGALAADHEYGSVKIPVERAFIERISPYQNLRKRDDFPEPFLITSTKDDNVLPAQARKYAAKLESFGMPYLYYETREGGHSKAITPADRAKLSAMKFTYLAQRLRPNQLTSTRQEERTRAREAQ